MTALARPCACVRTHAATLARARLLKFVGQDYAITLGTMLLSTPCSCLSLGFQRPCASVRLRRCAADAEVASADGTPRLDVTVADCGVC